MRTKELIFLYSNSSFYPFVRVNFERYLSRYFFYFLPVELFSTISMTNDAGAVGGWETQRATLVHRKLKFQRPEIPRHYSSPRSRCRYCVSRLEMMQVKCTEW